MVVQSIQSTGAEKKWADCGLSNNVSLPHVVIDQRDNKQ